MRLMYVLRLHVLMHLVFEGEKIGQPKTYLQVVTLTRSSRMSWPVGKELPPIQGY